MELCHVLSQPAWDTARAAGQHPPAALQPDEFLHCCTPAQLDFVLHRHFAGGRHLVVLTFEAEPSTALRWVASEPDQAPFPHLYGPIPCHAVRQASRLPHVPAKP